jgi:hypothetical protein
MRSALKCLRTCDLVPWFWPTLCWYSMFGCGSFRYPVRDIVHSLHPCTVCSTYKVCIHAVCNYRVMYSGNRLDLVTLQMSSSASGSSSGQACNPPDSHYKIIFIRWWGMRESSVPSTKAAPFPLFMWGVGFHCLLFLFWFEEARDELSVTTCLDLLFGLRKPEMSWLSQLALIDLLLPFLCHHVHAGRNSLNGWPAAAIKGHGEAMWYSSRDYRWECVGVCVCLCSHVRMCVISCVCVCLFCFTLDLFWF